MLKENLHLSIREAHIASLCVSIVCGVTGSIIPSVLLSYSLTNLALILSCSFIFSWVVCKYLFQSAHHWYGEGSIYHRVYDTLSILSGGVISLIF